MGSASLVHVIALFCGGLAFVSAIAVFYSAYSLWDMRYHEIRRKHLEGGNEASADEVLAFPAVILWMLAWGVGVAGFYYALLMFHELLNSMYQQEGSLLETMVIVLLATIAGIYKAKLKWRELEWQHVAIATRIRDTAELNNLRAAARIAVSAD